MNIKQKISVVLAASMLLPTAVSAAQFNVDDGAIIKPPRVSEDGTNPKETGKENPPEQPKGNTGNEDGKKKDSPSTNPEDKKEVPKEGEGTGIQPENPKEGETNKDPEVKEDNNVFLILKAVKEPKEAKEYAEYHLENPKDENKNQEKIIFTKDSDRIKGIDWNKVKEVTLVQNNNTENKNFITSYMNRVARIDNNLKFLAENYSNLDENIENRKNMLIKELENKINSTASEENKQTILDKIEKIKKVNRENIESADEDIKNEIKNDPAISGMYSNIERLKEGTKIPKLNLQLELSMVDGNKKTISARTIITNDGFTDNSIEGKEIDDIESYIDNLQNKIKEQSFELQTKIVEYNKAKEKYEKDKKNLIDETKKQEKNYKDLWEETEKLLKAIYKGKEEGKEEDYKKGTLQTEWVANSITKLQAIEKEFQSKIDELEGQKKKLEGSNKEIQAELKELKSHKAPDGSITDQQVTLLKDTIDGLMKAIQNLQFGHNTQGIPDTEFNRILNGSIIDSETGNISKDPGKEVNIEGLVIRTQTNEGEKVTINPKAIVEYIINNKDENSSKKENITKLINNIASLTSAVNSVESRLGQAKSNLVKKEEIIKDLNKQLAVATQPGTIGDLNRRIDELEKEKAQLESDKDTLTAQKGDLDKEIKRLEGLNAGQLEKQLNQKINEVEELKKQLQDVQNALDNLKNSGIDTENKKLSEVVGELLKAKKDLETLQNKFKGVEEALNNYDKSDKSLLQKVQELIEKANNSGTTDSAKVEELNKKIKTLNKEIEELSKRPTQKSLSDKQQELDKATKSLSVAEDNLTKAQEENRRLQGEVNKLTGELEASKKSGNISKEEAERLQRELNQAKQDLNSKNTELDGVKEELENLKKASGQCSTELDTLKTQLKEKDKKIQEQKGTIDELTKQVGQIKEEKNIIAAEKQKLDNQIAESTRNIKDLENQIREKDNLIDQKDAEILELTKKIAENNGILDQRNKSIEDLKAENGRLAEELKKNTDDGSKELKKTIEELNGKINTLTNEKNTLTEQNSNLSKEKSALEKQNSQLVQEKQAAESKLNTAKESNSTLNNQIKELNKQLKELGEENESNLSKIKTLEEDNRGKIAEINQLKKDSANNLSEIERLKRELQEKDNQIADLTNKSNTLKQQLQDLQNNSKSDRDKNSELEIEVSRLKGIIKGMEERIGLLRTGKLIGLYDKALKDLEAANNELTSVKGQLKAANENVARLQEQLAAAKAQCKPEDNQSAEKITQLERQLRESEAKNAGINQQLENIKTTTDAQIAELKRQLGIKDGTIADLKKKLKEKEAELKRLQEEKARIEKEKQKLKDENGRLIDENGKLIEENKKRPAENPAKPENNTKDLGESDIKIVPEKPEDKKDNTNKPGPVITNDPDYVQPDTENTEDNNSSETGNKVITPTEKENTIDKKIEDTKKEIENIKDGIKTIEAGGVIEVDQEGLPTDKYIPESNNSIGSEPNYLESEDINIVTPEKGTTYKGSGINPTYKEKDGMLNRFGEWILSNLGPRTVKTEGSKYIFAVDSNKYYIENNGERTEQTTDAAPFIQNDRTMFSINEISKIMGINVDWDNDLKVASFSDGTQEVAVQEGNNQLVKDRDNVTLMDSKPIIKNDRLFMSITSLNKAFNNKLKVTWNNSDRTVIIEK